MSNKFFYKMMLFASSCILLLTACENEDSSITVNEESSNMEYIIPEENNDSTVLLISSFGDLQKTLTQVVDEREHSLLQRGWIKVEDEPLTRGVQRAKRQIRTDTVYVSQETGDDYSDPSVYANFNAKFSKSMVDSINKVVAPEYRISTRKTYVCRWRLFGTYYNAKTGEQVASRPSPLCALVPATKSSYKERGYSLYLNGNQYQMDSYQLRIQWEKVSHWTTTLDIDWPFFPKSPSDIGHTGYQFIYAVSKRI